MTVTAIMAKNMLKPGGDINPLVWLRKLLPGKTEKAEPTGDGPYAKLCLLAIKARWATVGGRICCLPPH